tara:strand:- start:1485 stop:1763 length:279 start_codon:yes stop_codon:yes gene_type:complete
VYAQSPLLYPRSSPLSSPLLHYRVFSRNDRFAHPLAPSETKGTGNNIAIYIYRERERERKKEREKERENQSLIGHIIDIASSEEKIYIYRER